MQWNNLLASFVALYRFAKIIMQALIQGMYASANLSNYTYGFSDTLSLDVLAIISHMLKNDLNLLSV